MTEFGDDHTAHGVSYCCLLFVCICLDSQVAHFYKERMPEKDYVVLVFQYIYKFYNIVSYFLVFSSIIIFEYICKRYVFS